MADNTTLNAATTSGDVLATDDIGGVKFPRSKIVIGADGTNDGDVSAANPLPVKGTGTAGTANSGVVTIQGIASMTPVQIGDNSGSITVDNAGTFAVQVSNTPTVTGTGGTFPVTDSGGSLTVDDGGSSLTVDGSVSISGAVAVTDNSGSITVDAPVGTPVFVRLSDGTSAITALPITDNSGSITVDNAGTFAVQAAQSGTWNVGTVTTVTTCSTVTNLAQMGGAAIAMGTGVRTSGTQRVTIATDDVVPASQSGTWNITTCSVVSSLTGSGVQHDNADSGNPHKIGAKAIASLSGATLVAAADRTDLYSGVDGVLITRPHSNLEDFVNGTADITDGSSTSVIAAQGAGVKTYITDVIISNSSASAVTVTIRDGAAGAVKGTFMAPAGAPVHKTLQSPIAFSANTAVCADPSAAASTVSVTLSGFKSKV